jgi:peptidoglycan/xylan/chitin deacetylase (PgdA/CDA1 family)
VDRRRFLTVLAAGTAATLVGTQVRDAVTGWPSLDSDLVVAGRPGGAAPGGGALPAARPVGPIRSNGDVPGASGASANVPPTTVAPSPNAGVHRLSPQTAGRSTPPGVGAPVAVTVRPAVLEHLPVDAAPRFALTIDDGVSTEVLDAYVDFVIASGIRATFFVNGVYRSWTTVRPKLAPLVESGQVQLGNHTWNHPSITGLSPAKIVNQLTRNEAFLRRTYGVEGRPYFRPPYGHHNAVTDKITGGLGYDRTVMWYGSLGDSTVVTPAQIVAAARQWFGAQRIVIGHANFPSVTYDYPQLVELIRARNLQTVTLRDVFGDQPMVRSG